MHSSPFQVRGVIEGFYGVYYTPPERNELIRFIGENGFHLYIYGPKNDRQHRARWREPYSKVIMEQFSETVKIAEKAGVEFCYSIGSGVSMNYASEKDLDWIKKKFTTFYEIGVRSFAVLLDDISSEFRHEEEKNKYRSYAEAHSDVSNQLYNWLKEMDPSNKLLMCPTDYHGSAPFSSYIHELGEGLHPDIDIFYTGPDVCAPEISEEEAEGFAKAVKRNPVIWDNFPVNDLAMQPEMHIGPITGRDALLYKHSKGFVVNTMIQAEASKIPLLTFADYFQDPENYQPWKSWERALKIVAGEESYPSLMLFAENSLQSCLGQRNAVKLNQLAEQLLASLMKGNPVSDCEEAAQLYEYLDELDEAGYHLKNRMTNYALRNELVPWIEVLESWAWAGRRAIETLKAIEKGEDVNSPLKWMKESLRAAEFIPKQITGDALRPLIDYTMDQAEKFKGTTK